MAKHYKTIKEVADEWKISPRRVQILCNDGRIPGAFKEGRVWRIPEDCEKPDDNRVKDTQEVQQYFSGLRKSSYTFLDIYTSEVKEEISSILNYAYILSSGPISDDRVIKYAKNMSIAATRVRESTAELSKLIQFERGTVSVNMEVVNLPKAIERFFMYVKSSLAESKISCETSLDFSNVFALADLSLHFELHKSILLNFAKVIPEGGNLKIEISEVPDEDDNYIRVKHIFTTDSSVTALARKHRYIKEAFMLNIINFINGRNPLHQFEDIELENGLSFVLRYKKADKSQYSEDAERYWKSGSADADFSRLKGVRILFAEPNEMIRHSIAEMLGNYGVEIDTVESGIQLLSKLESSESDMYDLVSFEMNMPNLDGFATLNAIRNFTNLEKAGIPIIAVSDSLELDDQDILNAGADKIVRKVDGLVSVLRTINDLLFYKN